METQISAIIEELAYQDYLLEIVESGPIYLANKYSSVESFQEYCKEDKLFVIENIESLIDDYVRFRLWEDIKLKYIENVLNKLYQNIKRKEDGWITKI